VPIQLLKLQSKRLHAGFIYIIYRASWIILASTVLFEIWSYGTVSVGESGGQSNWIEKACTEAKRRFMSYEG
jgi:hypothetical protein